MIVKDEEDFLEACLTSAKRFVDEIIIVDTGSSDKTVEIAKKFTDKVYSHEWPNDFSKARNISIKYATKDWILILDADEALSDPDFEKIKKMAADKDADAYRFIQRNYTDNSSLINWIPCFGESKHTKEFYGYRPSKLTRMFRNKKGFEYRNKVHELVEYSIEEKKGKIIDTDIQIHHYGDLRKEAAKKEKGKKYFELGEEQIKERPNEARAYYETGAGCLQREEYARAAKKFEKVVELNPDYKDVYYNLGSAYHSLGKWDKAEEALKKSIENRPMFIAAYNLLGIIYQGQGKFQEAIDILFKGVKLNKDDLLLQSLGGVYVKLGYFDKAIKALLMALKINQKNLGALNNLAGAYLGIKDYKQAEDTLKKIIALDPKNVKVYSNLMVAYLRQGKKEEAIKLGEETIKKFPEQTKDIKAQIEMIKKQ